MIIIYLLASFREKIYVGVGNPTNFINVKVKMLLSFTQRAITPFWLYIRVPTILCINNIKNFQSSTQHRELYTYSSVRQYQGFHLRVENNAIKIDLMKMCINISIILLLINEHS